MNKKEPNLLIMGVISLIAATGFLISSQMTEKEPEKVTFRAAPESSSAESSVSAENVTSTVRRTEKPTAAASAAPATEPVTEQPPVNINTADMEQLMGLHGIGEVRAAAILEYRRENGAFRNIEELMNVSGIGEDTFSDIKEHIYVDDPVYPETTVSQTTAAETTTTKATETTAATEHKPTLEELAPININEAGIEELMLLPYVDEETAEAIIRLREDLKGFSHVYELLYIDKLTQKQVAEIVGFVTVGQ